MEFELIEYKISKNNFYISKDNSLVYFFENITLIVKDEISLNFNERFYNIYIFKKEKGLFKISIPYVETSLYNISFLISNNQLLLLVNCKQDDIKYCIIDLDNSETRYVKVNSKSKKSIEHLVWIHNFKLFKRIW